MIKVIKYFVFPIVILKMLNNYKNKCNNNWWTENKKIIVEHQNKIFISRLYNNLV